MFELIKKIFGTHSVDQENINLIRNSKYFDEDYYKRENPNINMDACRHYYYYGWKEGRSPSYEFSNNFYLKNYKDVEDAGINPLLHYLKFGKTENRVIEKDNGLSLKKVYEEIYDCPYFYKTYVYDTRNPVSILDFSNANQTGKVHPTQKPVPLLEYLIKTYTLENETVLDFTMGSGSTGVACVNTNRHFIGIELDDKYFSIAKDRIEAAQKEVQNVIA